MGCTRKLLGRALALTGVAIGLATGVSGGQASQLPPPTLTGPNGEYIHDTWRGGPREFPDVSVLALAQDPLGFLLVASPRGIYRFDGRQFLGPWTFPLNGVETILVDKAGSLWAASQTVVGLARRFPDGTTSQVLLPGGDRPVGPVGGIARAADGSIYFSVAEGIFRIRGGVPARLFPPGPSGLLAAMPFGNC